MSFRDEAEKDLDLAEDAMCRNLLTGIHEAERHLQRRMSTEEVKDLVAESLHRLILEDKNAS